MGRFKASCGCLSRISCTLVVVGLAFSLASTSLLAASPRLTRVLPRGGKVGTDVSLDISGERLKDAEGVFFFRPGIEVVSVEAKNQKRCLAKIRIKEGCPLGEHQLRLRTRTGISNLFTFFVGALPEVQEKESNSLRGNAQKIPLNVTVNGVIRNEDVDWFAIDARAGERIRVEVLGVRLGGADFDPHLTVFDPSGKPLLVVDDTAFSRMDPSGSLIATEAGTHFIQLRESAFGGSDRSYYRFSIGTFPRPFAAVPAGGRPGEALEVTYVGDPGLAPEVVAIPESARGIFSHFPRTEGGVAPTPVLLSVANLPNLVEPDSQPDGGSKPLVAKPWTMIGPFDNGKMVGGRGVGHDRVFPPEESVDLKKSYPGKGGLVSWVKRTEFQDGVVHSFVPLLAEPDYSLVYLAREIESPIDQKVTALMSSDDTLKVWLNGELLHEFKTHRGVSVDSDVVELPLLQGRNQLLLKVANGTGGFGFTFRFAESSVKTAIPCKVPVAINGCLSRAGEVDAYKFSAKKGRTLGIQVMARSLRSPVDSVIEILLPSGKRIQTNDDAGGPDSRLQFRVPEDGEYVLSIRDHLGSGGPLHRYRIEVAPSRRTMRSFVAVPGRPDDVTVSVPRGGRMATVMRASGVDVRANVTQGLSGLPEGVTVETVPFASGTPFVPILLSAASDAHLGGNLVRVRARASKEPKIRAAGFSQSTPLVIVRNNQTYLETRVDRIAVAVTDPVPFKVDLLPLGVPLIRQSPQRLAVKVTREAGFEGPVRVRMLWLPPGVRAGEITVAAGKTEGHIPINATGNAPFRTWKIAVVGSANVGGQVSVSSALTDLEVGARWVTATIGKMRTEQGKPGKLSVKLTGKKEFEGEFVAELLNLPRPLKTEFPRFTSLTQDFSYDVAVDPKAGPGRHKNLLLQLKIPTPQGEVIHHFRGGEIRIDKPLPKKRKKPKPAAKAPSGQEEPDPGNDEKKNKKGTLKNPKT